MVLGGILGFLNTAASLKTQSERHQALAYLSHAQGELVSLQSLLRRATVDGGRQDVLRAQKQFQRTLDKFQTVAARAPALIMAPHGDLRDLLRTTAEDLKKVRDEVAMLEYSGTQADALGLVKSVGEASERFDAIDRGRMETLVARSQQAIDNHADMQRLFVVGTLLFIPVLLLLSLSQARRFRRQQRVLEVSNSRFRDMCNTDLLTGLENREGFLDRVSEMFAASPHGGAHGVVVLKINGLKELNVQFGYAFGDDVISQLGRDLSDYVCSLNTSNLIARTGGAEFSCLVRGVTDVNELRIPALMLRAIVGGFSERGDKCFTLQGHAGVALGGASVSCARDLLLQADLAMQEAVANDKADGVAVYSQPLRSAQLRKKKIEDELQTAIENNYIYPVYQPQFDLRDGTMVGMEALARWNHPELGMIPPPEFIAASERVGGIVQIGRHILRTACEDAVTMRGNPCVSVNLSVLQIVHDDVPEFASKVLDDTGLDPARLKLEVTESVIISDSRTVYETLTRLKRLGIAISLDDFGTGYSLSYLTDFDWNELKIDRSFVAKALQSSRARDVARTVGALAKKMNARLTVEGIETSCQRDLFASIGYQVAQGYFYSKPLSFCKMNSSPYVLTTRDPVY
jgi:diguanylate cyclase (GGDEF)-like protein